MDFLEVLWVIYHYQSSKKSNEMKIDLKIWEAENANGVKVHHDGFELTNSLEWRSAVLLWD